MTTPGLALFYGGVVRKKNVLATMAQSFAVSCLIAVLCCVLGIAWLLRHTMLLLVEQIDSF